MTDIAACENKTCEFKESCYRWHLFTNKVEGEFLLITYYSRDPWTVEKQGFDCYMEPLNEATHD